MSEQSKTFDQGLRELHDKVKRDMTRDPDTARMIEQVASVTGIIHLLIKQSNQMPNPVRIMLSRTIYAIKESIDERYPLKLEDDGDGINAVMQICPVCTEEDDCPHGYLIRCALLTMAMLRIHPKIDMDTDDIDDPNDGMVEV